MFTRLAAIIALLALAQAPGSGPLGSCQEARLRYEALAFDEALSEARRGFEADPGAVECLEVEALVLLASGRPEEARARLTALFERAPDHEVRDPSLSPSTKSLIAQVREAVRPLSAEVRARWIVHRALRLDVALEGGLRGAARVRYTARVQPGAHLAIGEVELVGRAATATVAVPAGLAADRLELEGEVLDGVGRRILPFTAEKLLPARPAPQGVTRVVEPEEGGVPWWLWVAIGAVVVGGAVSTVVVAQPDLPSPVGLGRAEL